MRWDSVLVRALAGELHHQLLGQRVRAIRLDRAGRRVHLFLRESTLIAEMHPNDGWVLLLGPAEPDDEALPLPTRIRSVDALPDERILRISLERVRGREEGVWLILSWVGTRWNAWLVGYRSGRIHQVLLPQQGGDGLRAPGALWEAPPRIPRAGAPDGPAMDPAHFAVWQEEGRQSVLAHVAWSSSLNVGGLLAAQGLSLWHHLANSGKPDAGAWIHEGMGFGTTKAPLLYPVVLPGGAAPPTPVMSILRGMAVLRERSREQSPRMAAAAGPEPSALLLPPGLMTRVTHWEARLRKQQAALLRELTDAPDPDALRAHGDLLLAYFHRIPRGARSVDLEGFDGNPVTLSLDPALGVQENAARLYARASRAERARREIPQRIAQAEAAQTALTEVMSRVLGGETGVETLRQFLDEAGAPDIVRAGARAASGRGQDQPSSLPYHRFRSSSGFEIRVGRGARQNDALTFQHTRPGEIWLHVREAPGAHVVLRWEGEGNPPARDLEEAAILAALHSDARHAGIVPVDWTRRRHVRKPRKSAPGAVIPAQVRTVFVEPDPAVQKNLRW